MPHVDREAENPIPREDDLFLYVARLDRGKGQADFLERVAARPDAYRGRRFAFFLEASLDLGDARVARGKDQRIETGRVARAVANATRAGVDLVLYERRIASRSLKHNLTAARGLVHLATFDRNPRVLYEALDHGTPVMTSVQTQAYRGLECAPPAVAVVVDAAGSANAVAAAFAAFLRGTADRAAASEAIANVVDGLRPQAVYPCLCAALDVCRAPRTPAHAAFAAALEAGGARVPAACPLGRRLEGVRCAKSDLFACVRWGSWLEGARVASGQLGAQSVPAASIRRRGMPRARRPGTSRSPRSGGRTRRAPRSATGSTASTAPRATTRRSAASSTRRPSSDPTGGATPPTAATRSGPAVQGEATG